MTPPDGGAVAVLPSASSAAPAASAPATAAPVEPGALPPYEPLPQVTACAACPWPGTGCAPGSDKECALDPKAWWQVRVERVKPAHGPLQEETFCVVGTSGGRACGKTTKQRRQGFLVLGPDEPGTETAALSTPELLGLELVHLTTQVRGTPAVVVSPLQVGEALFKKGVLLRDADGEEAWLLLSPGKAPSSPAPPLPALAPRPDGASTRDPSTFARAQELARKAEAIDARIAGYRREVTLSHRRGGGEVFVFAYFDGGKMVKAVVQVPYRPPTVETSYYFEQDRLFASRSVVSGTGDGTRSVRATFHDEKGPFWTETPSSGAEKPEAASASTIFGDLRSALKDPAYRIEDENL